MNRSIQFEPLDTSFHELIARRNHCPDKESVPSDPLLKWIGFVLFLRHGHDQFILILENDRPVFRLLSAALNADG
jgi:hypothetical protein